MTTEQSEARPMRLRTPSPVPAATGDHVYRVAHPLSESELKRQGERRREAERKLALHIQRYRETHPLRRAH
ncbi:hypothetical protein [Arthrobacter sp. MDT1-65]